MGTGPAAEVEDGEVVHLAGETFLDGPVRLEEGFDFGGGVFVEVVGVAAVGRGAAVGGGEEQLAVRAEDAEGFLEERLSDGDGDMFDAFEAGDEVEGGAGEVEVAHVSDPELGMAAVALVGFEDGILVEIDAGDRPGAADAGGAPAHAAGDIEDIFVEGVGGDPAVAPEEGVEVGVGQAAEPGEPAAAAAEDPAPAEGGIVGMGAFSHGGI